MRSLEQLERDVIAAIDARRDELIAIGRDIWKHPEAGFREFRTSKLIAEKLSSQGLSPKTGMSQTGIRADLKCAGDGLTLAILGELDSLIIPTHPECDPQTGCVHACGHNAIITGMLGAAMAMTDSDAAAELAGKLAFIACPGEECIDIEWRANLLKEHKINALGGKASLILDGVFDDVDIAYMNHTSYEGDFGVSDYNGFVMKSVVFHGIAAHAAHPRESANALSAANLALHALALHREQYMDDQYIRSHGILTGGGEAVNIVPDTAKMDYQLRANDFNKINRLSTEFDNVMKGCALAMGCTVDIQTYAGYMPLHNNADLAHIYDEAVHMVAPDAKTNILSSYSMASTDMGDVSTIIPAIHGYADGSAGTGHGIDYRIANEEHAYVRNAKILALMAVKLLYGDATKGRAIAAQKQKCMPLEEYKKLLQSLNSFYSNYKN